MEVFRMSFVGKLRQIIPKQVSFSAKGRYCQYLRNERQILGWVSIQSASLSCLGCGSGDALRGRPCS